MNQTATRNAREASPQPATSTSEGEVLVKVEGVSKKFCRSLKKSMWYGVCDIAAELLPFGRNELQADGSKLQVPNENNLQHATPAQLDTNSQLEPPLRAGEFWAVHDVSFELRRGECLGLIGRNGAGKTTLLKMLTGLIKPDAGHITMRGRIGALIALGAGFNPVLTGRENIYVNGSVLGLSKKEIDEKMEEIIDFAEIREFIDTPVQSYSSGMQVRLGFAVATTMNPDVLILDEVLAVGDAAFRFKCSERISRALEKCAVIFVSHSAAQLGQICNRGLVLEKGQMRMLGSISRCLDEYEGNQHSSSLEKSPELISDDLECLELTIPKECCYGDTLECAISLKTKQTLEKRVHIRCGFSRDGMQVAEFFAVLEFRPNALLKYTITTAPLLLAAGRYYFDIHVLSENRTKHIFRRLNLDTIVVRNAPWGIAPYITVALAR